jgi:hypothetical protein
VVKAGVRIRALRLQIDATDQVGNQTTLKQTIVLKH